MGGENITMDDDDPALVPAQPCLLTNVTPKRLGLSFMSLGELGTWSGAQYVRALAIATRQLLLRNIGVMGR